MIQLLMICITTFNDAIDETLKPAGHIVYTLGLHKLRGVDNCCKDRFQYVLPSAFAERRGVNNDAINRRLQKLQTWDEFQCVFQRRKS